MNQLGGVGRHRWQASGPGNRGGVHESCQSLARWSRAHYPLGWHRYHPRPPPGHINRESVLLAVEKMNEWLSASSDSARENVRLPETLTVRLYTPEVSVDSALGCDGCKLTRALPARTDLVTIRRETRVNSKEQTFTNVSTDAQASFATIYLQYSRPQPQGRPPIPTWWAGWRTAGTWVADCPSYARNKSAAQVTGCFYAGELAVTPAWPSAGAAPGAVPGLLFRPGGKQAGTCRCCPAAADGSTMEIIGATW